MHFSGQDEAGKWGLVGHDVEAFTAEMKRHGAWSADLQLFCREVKQLDLPLAG
jgi:putative metallopeptidase